MTAGELLSSLRARGVQLRDDGGALHVAPASALSDKLRAAVREHAEELLALLRAPRPRDELVVNLEVDAVLRAEEDAQERARAALMAPRPPVVLYRVRRGLVPLDCLLPWEVRRLEATGRMTGDDVRRWARDRRRWL